MGNSEEAKPAKSEKSSPPASDQNNVHVYPDWAAMQAYYGPRLAVPPYLNSAVAPPHAPYMWGPPQSMMPPYGPPYAAFYPHGGVYAHPGVPMAGTALSMDTQAKSSENTGGGFVKKLKEFDGLAMSIGNGNGDSTDPGTDRRLSDSDETDGSSDGSNGVTPRAGQSDKKRSRQGSPNRADDGKALKKSSSALAVEACHASEKIIDGIPSLNVKSSPINTPQPSTPNEAWLQNERELKRERRKQSNRESARRSRLRKQAETEELAIKVQALTAENMTLKSEINKLMENAEKLKLENSALVDKLKHAQLGQTEIDDVRPKPIGTVNLLARVNNSDSTDRRNEESDSYENRSPAKLHQLLDNSPRTDAVAAG